ncbi:endolytic transglycosylase MltG [bacterium]|nr:endolytic transglycosylase MltG [bacterium]
MKIEKKIKIIIFIIIFFSLSYYIYNQTQAPKKEYIPTSFLVEKGQGVQEIGEQLKEKNLIKNKDLFTILCLLSGAWTKFKPGSYALSPNMNLFQIIKTLTTLPKAKEITITIKEGWTNEQIAEYLENQGVLKKEDFLQFLENPTFSQKEYGFLEEKAKQVKLQGYLFPDTYRIYEKSTPEQIVKKMLDNFQQKYELYLKKEIEKQNKSLFEIVNLASLIEKEASDEQDKKIVSGIFQKRLELNMPLESCATINYLLKTPKKRLSQQDLQIDSPYNTYLYPGLPPGPINNPSLDSLKAALFPLETDYLFFLAGPNGKNIYARTLTEHIENKRKYLNN